MDNDSDCILYAAESIKRVTIEKLQKLEITGCECEILPTTDEHHGGLIKLDFNVWIATDKTAPIAHWSTSKGVCCGIWRLHVYAHVPNPNLPPCSADAATYLIDQAIKDPRIMKQQYDTRVTVLGKRISADALCDKVMSFSELHPKT